MTTFLLTLLADDFWSEFWSLILNRIEPVVFIVYWIYGTIGIIVGFSLEIFSKWKYIRTKGGFSWKYWITDNSVRIIVSFFCLFVGIVTSSQLLGTEPSIYSAFVTGLSIDGVIKSFMRRSKEFAENG